ncbi:MAG: hypothetical protein AB1Z98_34190 [Nannocystaceae bacterium]
MSLHRFLTISNRALVAAVFLWPTLTRAVETENIDEGGNGNDASQEREQAEIDQTWEVGTGLFWGGTGVAVAGTLTFVGLVPTNRDFLLAEGRLDRCQHDMALDPVNVECQAVEDEVARSRRARTAVAVVGSVALAGGVALLGTGIWMRRNARRRQRELEKARQPEWALVPRIGFTEAGVSLRLRF